MELEASLLPKCHCTKFVGYYFLGAMSYYMLICITTHVFISDIF
jgi:hypothetical protein